MLFQATELNWDRYKSSAPSELDLLSKCPPVVAQHYSSESHCTERSNYFWRKWNEPRCAQNHKRPLLVLNLTKIQMSFMLSLWWQIKVIRKESLEIICNSFSKKKMIHLAVEAQLTKVKSCLICEEQFREKTLSTLHLAFGKKTPHCSLFTPLCNPPHHR